MTESRFYLIQIPRGDAPQDFGHFQCTSTLIELKNWRFPCLSHTKFQLSKVFCCLAINTTNLRNMDPILIQGTLTAIVKWIGKSRAKKKEIERIALAAEQARIEQKRANEVRREDMRQRSQRCCGACAIVVGADAAFCQESRRLARFATKSRLLINCVRRRSKQNESANRI